MLEMLLKGDDQGDYFLHIDPTNQTVGSTQILDLLGRQTISNSGEVVVASDGPFANTKSLKFDSSTGARDYFRVANNKLSNVLTGNFTVEFWFKQTNRNPGSNVVLLGHWVQSPQQGGFIFWSKNGQLTFGFGPFSGDSDMINGTTSHGLNTWNHLAATRDGSKFTLWLNGNSIGTATSGAISGKIIADVTAGVYQNANAGVPDSISAGFNGNITGVKMYAKYCKYKAAFTPQL